jgi:hypothetical protein
MRIAGRGDEQIRSAPHKGSVGRSPATVGRLALRDLIQLGRLRRAVTMLRDRLLCGIFFRKIGGHLFRKML